MTSIRPASPDEADVLAALHVRTWQEAYAGLMPEDYLRSLNPADRLPTWRQILIPESPSTIFVAEFQGELIGFSSGGPSGDEDADLKTGEVYSIYLLREFWDKGIGKELHDTLLTALHERGYEKATLWVLDTNDRTRRWYERQGWKHDGSQKNAEMWGATLAEVRYSKQLTETDVRRVKRLRVRRTHEDQ